jgi:2-polyprenyl-3-methyl-5-hydroxy-6-metoxy-1,4-benzoquinol methylase
VELLAPKDHRMDMYLALEEINRRPAPFERYTAADLWTDEHISSRMLDYHLNGSVDIASRNTRFMDRSAAWLASRFVLAEGKAVADFGCGPGLYTARFAASGAFVTGVDFSERSLRHARESARREGLSIDYVCGD